MGDDSLTSITCECGERVEFRETTNDWHDQGFHEDAEALYQGECTCNREFFILQYKH